MDEIKLFKNNDNKDWSDLKWIKEFYSFLQGELPDQIELARGHKVKLSPKKAFSIIWYLQEHFPLLPDRVEKCDCCGELFDSYRSGTYSDKTGKNYCGNCLDQAPDLD